MTLVGGAAEVIGGTSAVAPLWAGLIALLNESLAKQGKPAAGLLNPILYQLPATSSSFHDIIKGNNDLEGLGKYAARPSGIRVRALERRTARRSRPPLVPSSSAHRGALGRFSLSFHALICHPNGGVVNDHSYTTDAVERDNALAGRYEAEGIASWMVALALPAQTVDATPSNALIR